MTRDAENGKSQQSGASTAACGHDQAQLVTSDEGTSYCPACEDEARATPKAQSGYWRPASDAAFVRCSDCAWDICDQAQSCRKLSAAKSRLLPSECPNCGRLHEGANFRTDPGPVQKHLAALAEASMKLVEAYNELGYATWEDDNVNGILIEIEEAGLLTFKVVVEHG